MALVSMTVVARLMLVPVPLQLLLYVGCVLYIASHNSLAMLSQDPLTGKAPKIETVSNREMMLVPAVAGLACAGLGVAYKFFGRTWVNPVVTALFLLICVAASAASARVLLAAVLSQEMRQLTIAIPRRIPNILTAGLGVGGTLSEESDCWHFSKVDMLAYAISGCLAVIHLLLRDSCTQNLLVLAFSLQAAERISLRQFMFALLALGAILVYEGCFLFSAQMMLRAPSSLHGPLKVTLAAAAEPAQQSALGLAELIAPGVFAAMCLRMDAAAATGDNKEPVERFARFPKPLFWCALVACLMAVLLASGVEYKLERVQPKLLYMLPVTVGAVLVCSFARGSLEATLRYSEEELIARSLEVEKDSKKSR